MFPLQVKKVPPKTQQTSRPRPESLLSIPHTSSSSQRTQNFWASSTTYTNSQNLNLYIHNSYQKPTSSIFLTSKPNNLTPSRKASNPLLRKFSEPLANTERPSTTPFNNEYRSILNKESPLTLRANNSSRFYRKLKKAEDEQKISSNRLILDSYGLQKTSKEPYPLNKSTNRQDSLESSVNSYGIRRHRPSIPLKNEEKISFQEEFFMRPNFKHSENLFQKTIQSLKPKNKILKINKEFKTENEDDPFDKNSANLKKFKVRTFLSQKEELKMRGTQGNLDREVNKRLVQPRLYEKIENIKKRTLLVVENIYLTECKNQNSLKYCYLRLPVIENLPTMPSAQIENEFQEVLRVIKEKFNINAKEIFIFLKNGQEMKSHYEIPPEEKTIIISGNRIFKGINRLLQGNKIQGFLLMKTLHKLEGPLLDQETPGKQPISIEQHIKNNYTDVVNEVIDILGDTGEKTSADLEKINQIFDKRNKIAQVESVREKKIEGRLNFKDKNDYFDTEKSDLPLIYSKKFDDVCKICDLYEKNNQEIEFDKMERDDEEDEGGLMQELENVKNLEEKEMKKMANYLDYLLEKWMNPRKKVNLNTNVDESKSKEEETIMIDYGEDEEGTGVKKNYVEENRTKYESKRGYIQKLSQRNKEIFLQNIPKLLKRTNFTRRELHGIYILYKALQEVTSQRYEKYNLDEGLDYYTFRNGIYQVFVQSEGLAKMIFNTIDFNYSGFLNWEEFLNLMVIIKAKTLREKIDLFIKIADEDGNGMLSKTEIFNLCKICLSKFISEAKNDHFLDDLCDYFTKLIFGAVNIDIEDEIPLQTIKEAILSGNEESDLLAMFCGADM